MKEEFEKYWNEYGEIHATMCNGDIKAFAKEIWMSGYSTRYINDKPYPHKPEPVFSGAPISSFIGLRDPKEPLDGFADNVIFSRLAEIAICAGDRNRTDVGDSIDRGLILLRMLKEAGFSLMISDKNESGK